MLELDIQKKRGDFSIQIQRRFTAPCVGIFGPSGSGKSTLLHIVAGLMRPDSGSIHLNRQTLFDRNTNIPPQKRNIGYVRQDALLFPHMSVYDNLRFAQTCTQSKTHEWTIEKVVEIFSVQDLLHRKPITLSGGEKQKVSLARSLIASPQLILLDEPMASLDEPAAQEILTQLHALKSTLPMIYVSHNKTRVHNLCDEILYLDHGTII